jgi:hypothetical protein
MFYIRKEEIGSEDMENMPKRKFSSKDVNG